MGGPFLLVFHSPQLNYCSSVLLMYLLSIYMSICLFSWLEVSSSVICHHCELIGVGIQLLIRTTYPVNPSCGKHHHTFLKDNSHG